MKHKAALAVAGHSGGARPQVDTRKVPDIDSERLRVERRKNERYCSAMPPTGPPSLLRGGGGSVGRKACCTSRNGASCKLYRAAQQSLAPSWRRQARRHASASGSNHTRTTLLRNAPAQGSRRALKRLDGFALLGSSEAFDRRYDQALQRRQGTFRHRAERGRDPRMPVARHHDARRQPVSTSRRPVIRGALLAIRWHQRRLPSAGARVATTTGTRR